MLPRLPGLFPQEKLALLLFSHSDWWARDRRQIGVPSLLLPPQKKKIQEKKEGRKEEYKQVGEVATYQIANLQSTCLTCWNLGMEPARLDLGTYFLLIRCTDTSEVKVDSFR